MGLLPNPLAQNLNWQTQQRQNQQKMLMMLVQVLLQEALEQLQWVMQGRAVIKEVLLLLEVDQALLPRLSALDCSPLELQQMLGLLQHWAALLCLASGQELM